MAVAVTPAVDIMVVEGTMVDGTKKLNCMFLYVK
uniref:Uncharacterized protein n=1 Tax=Arundo donax TaxID=35708 RepID=A0A0A8ZYP8_ARUDO